MEKTFKFFATACAFHLFLGSLLGIIVTIEKTGMTDGWFAEFLVCFAISVFSLFALVGIELVGRKNK